jgi:zinc transport system ATP-binding protein
MSDQDSFILIVKDLNVTLQNQVVLDNINFKVSRGTILAIVGPNGAGKTVLFKALLNLIPYTGKVEWSKDAKIGYVPQEISVRDVPISVDEFLSYKGDSMKNALSLVGLNDPNFAKKSLNEISGGQLRRVLIAWALMDDPNILLFDEPTIGVDTGSEESIFSILKEMRAKKGITMLLITHDVHLVKEYTDQLLGLNKCLTYFGDSRKISEPALQQRIYGETVCLIGDVEA